MLARNEGWFSSPTRNRASSKSSRRSVSRAVSSSGGVAKAGPLEAGQTVAELDPADVVAEPGMMRGRECPGRVEAAGGHVDEVGRVEVLVGERRAAGAAEASVHLGRGFVDHGCAA